MHGCATGKIETAEHVRPPVRVPGPIGDRVIYDRRPDEDEDNTRQDARAINSGTNSEGRTLGVKVSISFLLRISPHDYHN